jgi:predicted ArsR family transcriptional regulator
MARQAFVVNDAIRERVRYLAGVGVRQDDIAKMVGCAPKTLRKHLRDDLDRGVAEANATISGYLFTAAKAGNIAAIIFWLKTRAHWREQMAPNDQISDTNAESNSRVVVVLPDNGRDPELTKVLQKAQEEALNKYNARKRRRS